jgi:hypothetical protein
MLIKGRGVVRKAGLFFVLAVALSNVGWSQSSGFGVGVILGEPTGLSGKLWVSNQSAIDMGLAYSFRSKGYFHVHADYLWHFPDIIQSSERLPLYVGIGGRLAFGKESGTVGIRIPFGIAFWPRSAPIDIFVECVPILDLVPATEFRGNGGLGARFYFK